MKKILALCLFISLGFNLYLTNFEYVERDDFADDDTSLEFQKEAIDQVKLAQSAIAKKPVKTIRLAKAKQTCSCSDSALNIMENDMKKVADLSETDDVRHSEDYIRSQMEKEQQFWLESSEDFFIEELALNAEQIARYRLLAQRRQQELDEYFNKKHKNNDQGDGASLLFTSDDSIFIGKIAQKYKLLLKETFGEENYLKHKEFIKKHNSRINSEAFAQYIEF